MSTNEPFSPGTTARAAADRQVIYTDPPSISAGEELALGRRDDEWPGWIWCTNRAGKSSWTPERYIEERGDGVGVARQDYTAAELPLRAGEALTLHAEESGWYWATNAAGQSGWVPQTHIVLEDMIDR